MSTFTVLPIDRSGIEKVHAPVFYVDANDQIDAMSQAKKSALGRFNNWDFHVIKTREFERGRKSKFKKKLEVNKNSKSQQGKLKTGHTNSRPVRRKLRRGTNKMW